MKKAAPAPKKEVAKPEPAPVVDDDINSKIDNILAGMSL